MRARASIVSPRRDWPGQQATESSKRDTGLDRRREAAPHAWCRLSFVVTTYSRLFHGAPRALVAAFLLVTFMWAQHEMQRHTLQHVADQLQRHHEQGLQTPGNDLRCVECSLLAGGSHAVPGSVSTMPANIGNPVRIAISFLSRSVAASSYYSSRAPPVLL